MGTKAPTQVLAALALQAAFSGDHAGARTILEGVEEEQVMLEHLGDGVFRIVGTEMLFEYPEFKHEG